MGESAYVILETTSVLFFLKIFRYRLTTIIEFIIEVLLNFVRQFSRGGGDAKRRRSIESRRDRCTKNSEALSDIHRRSYSAGQKRVVWRGVQWNANVSVLRQQSVIGKTDDARSTVYLARHVDESRRLLFYKKIPKRCSIYHT